MKKSLLLKSAGALALLLTLTGAAAIWVPWSTGYMRTWVESYPDYFYDRPAFFDGSGRTSLLDQLPFYAFDWKLKQAWTARFSSLPSEEGGEQWIKHVVNVLDPLFLTQNEIPHPPAATSGAATLIRGYGYCDQVNSVLSFVLSTRFPATELVALVDPKTNTSPHTVVRLSPTPGTVAFADLWLNTHYLTGSESEWNDASAIPHAITQHGKSLKAAYQRDESDIAALYRNAHTLNRQDLAFQARKLLRKVFGEASDQPVAEELAQVATVEEKTVDARDKRLRMPHQLDPKTLDTQRKAYLLARFDGLWGSINDFRQSMAEFFRQYCDPQRDSSTPCLAARQFLKQD